MAKFPRVREQHLAVFGESGSGKTVLVSSFYGPTQDGSYSNDLWELLADETGQGNRLTRNYLEMRDDAKPPLPTRFESTTYNFSVKIKGADTSAGRKRAIDTLRLVWHDYPGEWFEESPSTEAEAVLRVDTFRSLLGSDVAFLLVDGQKLLDHAGEEERYLKSLFSNIRQGLARLKDDLSDDLPLTEFPRIWIIALSKADLFPDWDVFSFRDLLIKKVTEDIERLRGTLQELVLAPEAMALGEDFILLSSAKFKLSGGTPEPVSIDVSRQLGVDLILPIASMLPLERRVLWAERWDLPKKVLESLADGAEQLAGALAQGDVKGVQGLLAKLPKQAKFSDKLATLVLAHTARLAGKGLADIAADARKKEDHLKATLAQFKVDLERGVTEKVFIRSPK